LTPSRCFGFFLTDCLPPKIPSLDLHSLPKAGVSLPPAYRHVRTHKLRLFLAPSRPKLLFFFFISPFDISLEAKRLHVALARVPGRLFPYFTFFFLKPLLDLSCSCLLGHPRRKPLPRNSVYPQFGTCSRKLFPLIDDPFFPFDLRRNSLPPFRSLLTIHSVNLNSFCFCLSLTSSPPRPLRTDKRQLTLASSCP